MLPGWLARIGWIALLLGMGLLGCGGRKLPTDAARHSASLLRIGMTGDYPPFSELRDEAFVGVDVDLARDLGEWLGRPVALVRTSWPALLQDLRTERFHIAMSGIAITEARKERAFFSEPYYRGGKQAVVRCNQHERLSTLNDVNEGDVTVVTNRGGTNEDFARRHFKRGRILIEDDNARTFDRVAQGGADILFTDSIEASYRTRHDRRLCLGLQGKVFSPFAIAILMRRDPALRESVNRWLAQRLADGTVEALFERHLASPPH